MSNIDGLDTISNDELASLHERINKEVKRRAGCDVDVKKLRAQVYKLAKSLGCEWVPESLPGDLLEENSLPKRRGRKPKTDESVAVVETRAEQAGLRSGEGHIEEEKRNPLWRL